jgi:hypothetical protein
MHKRFVYVCAALLVLTVDGTELWAQVARTAVQAVLARMAPNKQLPDDLVLIGQVTDGSGTVQPFRITILGKDQIRYEFGTGATLTTTTQAKGAGWVEKAGKVTLLSPHSAMRRPVVVPFLDLLAEADNPSLQIIDKGNFTIGSLLTRQYNLKLPDPTPTVRMFRRALDEETDMYVDTQTLLIVRAESWLAADNNMDARGRSVFDFADYRIVNGFAIPFQIRSAIVLNGVKASPSVYVISQVTVNSGVSGSLFVAPRPTP